MFVIFIIISIFFITGSEASDDSDECIIETKNGKVDLNNLQITNRFNGYDIEDPSHDDRYYVFNFCKDTKFICSSQHWPAHSIHDDGENAPYCLEVLGSSDSVLLEESDEGVILTYGGGKQGLVQNSFRISVICDESVTTQEDFEKTVVFQGAQIEEGLLVYTFYSRSTEACGETEEEEEEKEKRDDMRETLIIIAAGVSINLVLCCVLVCIVGVGCPVCTLFGFAVLTFWIYAILGDKADEWIKNLFLIAAGRGKEIGFRKMTEGEGEEDEEEDRRDEEGQVDEGTDFKGDDGGIFEGEGHPDDV